MESMNILVTDQSPELAEAINSQLRNSGIKIHVIHTIKVAEIKRAIDQELPLMVLYANPDSASASLEEVSSLAHQYDIPFALYSDLKDPERLADALKITSCTVIHSESPDQLTATVNRLIGGFEQNRGQLQRRRQFEELEHRYNLILESARDAIAYIHEGLHVYANRAYLESLHVKDVSELAGVSLLEMMQSDDLDLKKTLQGLSKGVFPSQPPVVTVSRPDGSTFEAKLTFSSAQFNDEPCIQMLTHELDAASELTAEIERLRVIDSLTQLHNKHAFVERLETELAEPHTLESLAAVLYLEPDGIVDIQQELDVGEFDAFVADLASVLKSNSQEGDMAARLSDHGFALLIHQANMEKVEERAAQLLKAYRSHLVEIEDHSISVSCSIGIATLGRLARNSREVIAGARKAQMEAAEKGNTAITYRPQLMAVNTFEDDRQWVERIKYALSNDDFYSVQQAIIDLDGDGEHLMENITYLRDDSGDLAPAKYQEIADRNDLAGAIDRFIIPGLLKGFAESNDNQIISLSNSSIIDYSFPGWLMEEMQAHCVEGSKLILQISAATAQVSLKPAQRLMKELQPLGVKLSISGFDPERRTRQLLEHLESSYVKIHPSLTENLTGNSSNQDAIGRIVEAAEAYKVAVIADEVADTSSLATLWQSGVKLIAGAFLKENSQVVGQ